MEKFKVFGVDSNLGYFESVFDDKNRAYGFYMHRLENADFIEIIPIKQYSLLRPGGQFRAEIKNR